MPADHAPVSPPSAWVTRWGRLLSPGSRVLDLAAGSGRHSRWLAARGCRVEAVDRDPGALAGLSGCAGVTTRVADLEAGPWPYADALFEGIVVANYLHRPLFARLRAALAEGGVLIYETFMAGNERYGRPSNPDFLLQPGELLELAAGLQVVAYEAGRTAAPKVAVVQRLCAVRGEEAVELPGWA
jgi:SAM-dependent methyltransferase